MTCKENTVKDFTAVLGKWYILNNDKRNQVKTVHMARPLGKR